MLIKQEGLGRRGAQEESKDVGIASLRATSLSL